MLIFISVIMPDIDTYIDTCTNHNMDNKKNKDNNPNLDNNYNIDNDYIDKEFRLINIILIDTHNDMDNNNNMDNNDNNS